MRSCDDVLDLVPEVLPHLPPLSARQVAFEVQEHLRLCPSCADAAEEMARVTAALQGAAPAPALSADFADRVLDALPPAGGELGRLAPALVRVAAAVALFAGGFAAAGLRDDRAQVEVVRVPQPPQVIYVTPREALAPDAGPTFEPAFDDPAVGPVAVADRAGGADRPSPRWASGRGRPAAQPAAPLERYMTEATLVLEAVTLLDEPDPHWLAVISRHVDEAALLTQGERLLVELQRAPDRPEAQALRPLISATQVVLRKVRHAPERDPAAALTALRDEVHDAGLLDAYRTLLAPATPTGASNAPAQGRDAPARPGVDDPL